MRDGHFRADLYFRLRVVELKVPPLRDRHSDILPLARAFLVETARRWRRPGLRLAPAAEAALAASLAGQRPRAQKTSPSRPQ